MKTFENPFPGLRPFQANEAHLFFGRENQVGEILQILDNGRFVSVVGNSGSGKSSLIRAGILPKLKLDKDWLVVTMRPGSNSIETLASALTKSGIESDLESISIENTLLSSERGLIQVCRKLSFSGKKLFLLVDQFEEVFRFQSNHANVNESAHFAKLLVNSINQHDVPIYVMISLRSDFLGDCEQFEGLPQVINKGLFLIPRLNSDEIKTVITGPVNYAGAKISPVLVQKLANEIGNNPDQLPVLQHALMRTFETWAIEKEWQKPIDVESYEKTGGLSKALSNHAEEAFSELSSEQDRKLTESIFKVITLKGPDNRGVRRPTTVVKISQITGASNADIIRVLNVFRNKNRGFVMPPFNVELTEDAVIDISHESLMRVWERLKFWVDEEAESAELYRLLANSALLYEKDKAGLYHDPDLQLALDWKTKHQPSEAWANQYNPNFAKAMRFLKASEQHRKHLQKISTRYRKLVVSAMIVVFVALSLLSVWAFSERQNSIKNAKQAISEQKIAVAQTEIAEKQKVLAENSLLKANAQEKRALAEQAESEKQRNIAILRAEETRLQKLKAERASLEANDARKAAELDRQIAQSQKLISDSLRLQAERSEKNANRLRLLSVAQNIAINSRLRASGDSADRISRLMALQAYQFNLENGGEPMDPNIFEALLVSIKKTKKLANSNHSNVHTDAVKQVHFFNEKEFISTGDDGIVITGNIDKIGNSKKSAPTGLLISHLALNLSKSKYVFSGDNNKIYKGDISSLAAVEFSKFTHPEKITGLIWTSKGIITASADNILRLFDEITGNILKTLVLNAKPIAISGSELGTLFIGMENGDIQTSNTELDQPAEMLFKTGGGQINSLDMSKDGTMLAYGTMNGICGFINIANPTVGHVSFKGHSASVTSVKFQPNQNQLASSGLDGKVILWNTKTQGSPIVIPAHETWIFTIAFSSDGKYIISGSKDKTIKFWGTSSKTMYAEVKSVTSDWFTENEWKKHIGSDIPYISK